MGTQRPVLLLRYPALDSHHALESIDLIQFSHFTQEETEAREVKLVTLSHRHTVKSDDPRLPSAHWSSEQCNCIGTILLVLKLEYL